MICYVSSRLIRSDFGNINRYIGNRLSFHRIWRELYGNERTPADRIGISGKFLNALASMRIVEVIRHDGRDCYFLKLPLVLPHLGEIGVEMYSAGCISRPFLKNEYKR
jgi:hypothetical protein